jgi:ketosteroid isomerase-like protein
MLRRATLLIVVALGCAAEPRALSDAHAAALRDSARTMLATFQRLSAAQQWDSVASLYAEDSTFWWAEQGTIRYRAGEIRRALTGMPRGMRIETTYEGMEIVALAPGLASVMTRFQTRIGDSAAVAASFGGVVSMTLQHRAGGWRIISGHTSSPVAGTGPPAR